MAGSRRSASNADAALANAVDDAVRRAVEAALDAPAIAIAYSGGVDSTVLLHAACRFADPSRVVALHVQHGLQAAARDWPAHCAAQAARWGARFDCLALDASPPAGDSIEQWARDARYRVLLQAARRLSATRLWTAHHADDQVETLLLRLGRGAGLSGLLGIEARRWRDGAWLERPLLALPRDHLIAYARHHGLAWVDDPSNDDPRFARNALRRTVLPALDAAMPGFRRAVVRNLAHWRAAADTLDELAHGDLAGIDRVWDRSAMAGLTPARRAWAWRAWLARAGLRAPDTARFEQMRRQLLDGRSPHARVDHDGAALLRYRDRVSIVPLAAIRDVERPEGALSLAAVVLPQAPGQRIELGPGRGWLAIESATHGDPDAFDAGWLAAGGSSVRCGSQGAHRQRLRADGPSRPLKHLYQQFAIAPWLRRAMPVVLVRDDVLFSGAFGSDRSPRWREPPQPSGASGGDRSRAAVRLAWTPDPRWLDPLRESGYPWGPHV